MQDKNRTQQDNNDQQSLGLPQQSGAARSSAFNEPKPEEQKSTSNNEESDLEQERKEAMTERD